MKMKYTFLTGLLAFSIVLSGCGNNDNNDQDQPATEPGSDIQDDNGMDNNNQDNTTPDGSPTDNDAGTGTDEDTGTDDQDDLNDMMEDDNDERKNE